MTLSPGKTKRKQRVAFTYLTHTFSAFYLMGHTRKETRVCKRSCFKILEGDGCKIGRENQKNIKVHFFPIFRK